MKNAKVSSVYEGKVEEDEEEEAGRSRAARQKARARMRNFKRVYVRAPPRPFRRRNRVTRSMAWNPSASPGVVKEKEDEDHQNLHINNNSYYMGMAEGEVVENHENFIIDGGDDERVEYPRAEAEAVVEVEVEMEMEAGGESVVENEEEEKGNNNKEVVDVDEMKNNKNSGIEAEETGGGREESKWAISGWYDGLDDWPMEWSYEEEWLWMGRELGLGFSNPQWEYVNGVGWVDKKGPEI